MREIKFRIFTRSDGLMGEPFAPLTNEWLSGVKAYRKRLPKDAIVMQFTGLKDKNGKEIYEGDLFLCHYAKDGCKEQPMEVIYHTETCAFRFKRRGICQQYAVIQQVYDHAGWRGEVIGNIYENPGLLK